MSLITEALRKARKEAAGQRPGGSTPLPGGRPEGRRKSNLFLWPVIILLAGAAGSGISWWFLRRVPTESIPDVVVSKTGAAGEKNMVRQAAPAPALSPLREKDTIEDVGISAVTTPGKPKVESEGQDATPGESARSQEPAVIPTPIIDEPESPVFTAEAEIDGQRLTLDYLVFRKDHPFAQINGITVFEGGVIEGWVLNKVLSDRIILTSGDEEMTIKVVD